jgi:hypothetical protein
MHYKKTKNGIRIEVKKWDNVVTLTDIATKTIIKTMQFSDHIKAVQIAQAL